MPKQLVQPCAKIGILHVLIDPNVEVNKGLNLGENTPTEKTYECRVSVVCEFLDSDGNNIGIENKTTHKVYNESEKPMEISKCMELGAEAVVEIEESLKKEYTTEE